MPVGEETAVVAAVLVSLASPVVNGKVVQAAQVCVVPLLEARVKLPPAIPSLTGPSFGKMKNQHNVGYCATSFRKRAPRFDQR